MKKTKDNVINSTIDLINEIHLVDLNDNNRNEDSFITKAVFFNLIQKYRFREYTRGYLAEILNRNRSSTYNYEKTHETNYKSYNRLFLSCEKEFLNRGLHLKRDLDESICVLEKELNKLYTKKASKINVIYDTI